MKNVINFPDPPDLYRPIVEAYGPPEGPFEVYVWKNRRRDDGLFLFLETVAQVEDVIEVIKTGQPRKFRK